MLTFLNSRCQEKTPECSAWKRRSHLKQLKIALVDTRPDLYLILRFLCVPLEKSHVPLVVRVPHFENRWLRLMSDSEVNRLKTGAFTFRLETLLPSSCLFHLTLLVSHLSSRDKWNLICDVEICAGLFEVLLRSHPLPRYIHCLFTFLMKERETNK